MNDDMFHADFSPPPSDEPSDAWREFDATTTARDVRAPPDLALAKLAARLPELGPVLWMTRDYLREPRVAARARSGDGVLIEHAALTPLAACERIVWHTRVTPQGPREWFNFVDREDASLAKMFLLPDTDYLAWDGIGNAHATAQLEPPAARWQAHSAFLRNALARRHAAATARILRLRHRDLPWLALLDAEAPLRISMLGLEFACAIVRSEGAELLSPFQSS